MKDQNVFFDYEKKTNFEPISAYDEDQNGHIESNKAAFCLTFLFDSLFVLDNKAHSYNLIKILEW